MALPGKSAATYRPSKSPNIDLFKSIEIDYHFEEAQSPDQLILKTIASLAFCKASWENKFIKFMYNTRWILMESEYLEMWL